MTEERGQLSGAALSRSTIVQRLRGCLVSLHDLPPRGLDPLVVVSLRLARRQSRQKFVEHGQQGVDFGGMLEAIFRRRRSVTYRPAREKMKQNRRLITIECDGDGF
jgi:hypothetical protein